MGNEMQWHYHNGVNQEGDGHHYWNSCFYLNFSAVSKDIGYIEPLVNQIKPRALVRIKANMHVKTTELLRYPPHTDYRFEHLGCILSLNTCDGGTILEDGTFIKSVANRILFFDPSEPHQGTTCTDADIRVNINMNYF
jgi:hypothetical protein